MIKTWINGKLTDIDKASVSIFDRGFLYGDGCFETMRSYAGVVFKIDEHLSRLLRSIKTIGLNNKHSASYFKNAISKMLKVNKLSNAYIRIAMTRGEGRIGIGYKDTFNPTVVIVTKNFEGYPSQMYSKGLSVKIAAKIRQNEFSPISSIKSSNFLAYIMARSEAQSAGYDDAVMLNTKDFVAEASTSNIFSLRRGVLMTPSIDSGILPGITRKTVIDIARKIRVRIVEKHIAPQDLLDSDEVFLTNSLAEILPVTRINSRKIGDGTPGELTKLLHLSYQKEVIRETLR